MFTIPGIRVHDALEWMFTFGWNLRSRCPGIRTRTARQHPKLLEMLSDGQLHLSGIERLAPHLRESNREELLARAARP